MRARATVKPKRPKMRRRRSANHRRVVILFLMLVLGGVLGAVALTSPYLYVKKSHVLGLKTIPANDVLQRALIGNECNILRLPKGAIAGRVRTNPVVRDVKIYRRLPDTVVFRVAERSPECILDTGSAKFVVDASGVPFRRMQELVAGLPVIEYNMDKLPVLGRPIKADLFLSAMDVLHQVKARRVEEAGKITVDQSSCLCLNVGESLVVKLGRPVDLAEKVEIAAQTLKRLPELVERGEYLDVTCIEAPALKMKD